MRQTKTARRYAQALLDLSVQEKTVDRVMEDMQALLALAKSHTELRAFLANPVIKNEVKKTTVRSLFEKHVSKQTMHFLHTLCDRNRENLLEEIAEAFVDLRHAQMNRIKADVYSVVDLTDGQVRELQKRILAMTGKDPQFAFHRDASLIGGFLVRMGDTVIDGSVRHQLEKLRDRFAAGHVLN